LYEAGSYDCIVVGAGHAGCEAAHAVVRMGCRVLLLTHSLDSIALMPCNPSVGGPAKGHVVAEIDALGGLMGRVADLSYLQMRMLNTGKGPAVRALRAQADKKQYQTAMRRILEQTEGLRIVQALVTEVLTQDGRVCGVGTHYGAVFQAPTVVITAGTYLEGKVIVGNTTLVSGPNSLLASTGLSGNLRSLGIEMGRFKTGTPPRIHRRSVDFALMDEQKGDSNPWRFSARSSKVPKEQLSCWLTYTTPQTHEIIRANLHRSPLYAGLIEGRGPRYCPSIEDKVVRFADKDRHQIFLEPEGYETDEMYVQGLSTSLPEDVQVEMLRSVIGLRGAEMMRPGYAIEYDYVVPTGLSLTLESKVCAGLFFAGQINGSSGYEEAAGQGLMAGANAAAQVLGYAPLILRRSEAYLGVLIDDLVTKGVAEPYRLMTSRAEHRLLLRLDNAYGRLGETAAQYGLISQAEFQAIKEEEVELAYWVGWMEKRQVRAGDEINALLQSVGTTPVSDAYTAAQLLRRPEVRWDLLCQVVPELVALPLQLATRVEIEVKYAGYIAKEREQVERFLELEHRAIPQGLRYEDIKALSSEAREKLARQRPQFIGQALRMSGVSPSDVAVLLVFMGGR